MSSRGPPKEPFDARKDARAKSVSASTGGGGGGAGKPTSGAASSTLMFKGCAQFRQRLVFATLAGRRLRIDGIRDSDEEPGLRDFEASFLRLLDKLTNGTRLEINETGTSLIYTPGFVVGGAIEHDCGLGRGIGWFVEGILPLLPFGKKATSIAFTGVTNDDVDLSVDILRTSVLPVVSHFGLGEGLALTIKSRGAPPLGGGSVTLTCPVVRELTPVSLVEEGWVKKVRGVAYTAKVTPQVANRMVEGARAVLTTLLPDVFIYTDATRGAGSGASPGFGVTLTATTTAGCMLSVQRQVGRAGSATATEDGPVLPEDLGAAAANALLDEIERGGCIDSSCQPLVLAFMALCPADVSRVRMGLLTPAGIATLRLLKAVWGITFRLRSEVGDPEAIAREARLISRGKAADPDDVAAQKLAGTKRRKGGDPDEDSEEDDGEDDDAVEDDIDDAGDSAARGKAAKASKAAAAVPSPLTIGVGTPKSARTVLVACQGIGFRNLAKKVT